MTSAQTCKTCSWRGDVIDDVSRCRCTKNLGTQETITLCDQSLDGKNTLEYGRVKIELFDHPNTSVVFPFAITRDYVLSCTEWRPIKQWTPPVVEETETETKTPGQMTFGDI